MAEHAHNTPPSTPVTRRVLALGAGAFSAVGITAGAAARVAEAAPNPDAELIRLCAEFDGYERQRLELFKLEGGLSGPQPELEAQRDALADLQEPLLDEIWERPPQTPEGWRALAATLVLWAPDYVEDGWGGWDECLRNTLFRGMLGRA